MLPSISSTVESATLTCILLRWTTSTQLAMERLAKSDVKFRFVLDVGNSLSPCVPVSTLHDSINGNELMGKIVARVDDDANKAAVECN
ncbi:hypothetical protein AAG906_025244 [Vitis piasezkii]